MMHVERGDGGALAGAPAVEMICTAARQVDRGQATPLPLVAEGVFYPPAGRRLLGVVVVRSCPSCGELHLHRADSRADADGAGRRGSCGAPYVVQLLPAEALGGVA